MGDHDDEDKNRTGTVGVHGTWPIVDRPLAAVTILLAEDDAIVAGQLEEALQLAGAYVIVADCVASLLDLAKGGGNIDVAFIGSRSEDGEACDAIRRLATREPRCAVVALAGNRDREHLERCYEAGAARVETKPVGIREIVDLATTLALAARAYRDGLAAVRARWVSQVSRVRLQGNGNGARQREETTSEKQGPSLDRPSAVLPPGDLAHAWVDSRGWDRSLTVRERDIFREAVVKGRVQGEVASVLHLSPRTVKDYYKRLNERFGVGSIRELRQLFRESLAVHDQA